MDLSLYDLDFNLCLQFNCSSNTGTFKFNVSRILTGEMALIDFALLVDLVVFN